ncbi:MAG: hypothetical protein ACRDZ4_00730 [Egibacteraceae bacterium]
MPRLSSASKPSAALERAQLGGVQQPRHLGAEQPPQGGAHVEGRQVLAALPLRHGGLLQAAHAHGGVDEVASELGLRPAMPQPRRADRGPQLLQCVHPFEGGPAQESAVNSTRVLPAPRQARQAVPEGPEGRARRRPCRAAIPSQGAHSVIVIVRILVATALAVCRRQHADGLNLVDLLLRDALAVLDDLDDG